MRFTYPSRKGPRVLAVWTVLAIAGSGVLTAQASAKGGTAKPPQNAVSPIVTPTLADPNTSVPAGNIHGFDVTGFAQEIKVDGSMCPSQPASRAGGSVTVNGQSIVIPCNLVVQMPANTLTWADFAAPDQGVGPLAVSIMDANKSVFPAYEIHLVGNTVGDKNIAGLAYVSQQSTDGGSGVITKIDYSTGRMTVDTSLNGSGASATTIEINDPHGRFGLVHHPDDRFSVDDANPTIHAGTGYPMCVPRTDPTVTDDPLCPQKNRPALVAKTVGGVSVPATTCRRFSQAGVVPPASGELSPPVAGQPYCTQFVMPPAGTANAPDPTQQAPFEVGDFITFSGTAMMDATVTTNTLVSANTIEANLGIYTQPGTQPGYVAIGEFGVGSADPSATAISGIAQETADRIFLEAETTDVKTPVDIYMMDVDKSDGTIKNRWVTPFEMTGENQTGIPSGGITTQNVGPQPQRARIRATKAPAGLLSQPTRTIRVMQRTLCAPQPVAAGAPPAPYDQAALDKCVAGAPTVANGLTAGQYVAPVFEYIFPENVKPGDGIVPNDLWHLPFIVNGEGATTQSQVGPSVGPLAPAPW